VALPAVSSAAEYGAEQGGGADVDARFGWHERKSRLEWPRAVDPARSGAPLRLATTSIAPKVKPRGTVQMVGGTSVPRSSALMDLLCIFACFLLVHLVRFDGLDFTSHRTVSLFSSVAILILALSASGIYQTKRQRGLRDELMKIVACWSCAFAIIGLFAFLSKTGEDISRVWLSGSMLFALGMLIGMRVLRSMVVTVGKEARRKNIVIYGCAERVEQTVRAISETPDSRVRVAGVFEHLPQTRVHEHFSDSSDDVAQQSIDFIERQRRTGSAIEQVWIVLPADRSRCIEAFSERLSDSSVDVCVVPDEFTDRILDGEITRIGHMRVVNVSEISLSPAADQMKRVLDTILCLAGLSILCIPMVMIALLIKLESPGPVIFRQKRYGVDGKEIEILKFRSMFVHDDKKVRQAVRGDNRVTRFGGILRRTSLDELPQLLNVLRGTMSLVGPRPHAVAHNELWRHQIRGYMLRHKVRPGITGWAQINGWRGETDTALKMEQRVDHDLHYIRNWSLWLDVKIIFLTVYKGLYDRNAY